MCWEVLSISLPRTHHDKQRCTLGAIVHSQSYRTRSVRYLAHILGVVRWRFWPLFGVDEYHCRLIGKGEAKKGWGGAYDRVGVGQQSCQFPLVVCYHREMNLASTLRTVS